MPHYRRMQQPGGTFFFTVVTANRTPILTTDSARPLLRKAMREAQEARPFEIIGIVILPDHLHSLWKLPNGDSDFSTRWAQIKARFTRQWLSIGGGEQDRTINHRLEGRRGVWQARFFEHCIRDEDDLAAHLDYIHFNPVKHGYVAAPRDWP